MSVFDTTESLIQNILGVPNYLMRLGTNYKTRSLLEVTQVSRVEPLTIVSKDLITVDYMPDVMQSILQLFTGYYLQAVALSAKVDNVRIVKVLDRLNPDRHFNDLTLISEGYQERHQLAIESHKYRLPTSDSIAVPFEVDRLRRLSLEFIDETIDIAEKATSLDEDEYMETRRDRGSVNEKELIALKDASSLAVGKLINVTITVNEVEVKIPVNVRLATNTIPNASIVHLLTIKSTDESLVERYHSWRSGRIELIRDLILAQDLIDQHKKALMNDESGVYNEILTRAKNAKKYGLISANPSLAAASNIFVISNDVARDIEQKISGKLENPNMREKLFDNTYAMLICVIDKEWERVTIYSRGVRASTEVSIKDIKIANKGKGIDPMDVLKSLSQGTAPSF